MAEQKTIIFENHAQDARYTARTVCPTVSRFWGTGGGNIPIYMQEIKGLRRLTPREAERLMGFADDYTLITYRGRPAADTPRYKALGNSIAVPCLSWIGERIQAVDDLLKKGGHD